MKLDTDEAVHQAVADFDLESDEITDFFIAHDVDLHGVIHLGVIMARAALSSSEIRNDPAKALVALYVGGIAYGLHLSQKEAATT